MTRMPDDSVTPETLLSHVDGQAGSLIVCGHSLAELVADFGFVGCATMLWRMAATGPAAVSRPLGSEADRVAETEFARARIEAWALLPSLLPHAPAPDVNEALRFLLSSLAAADSDLPEAVRLCGAVAVFAAALIRRETGQPPLAPDPCRAHSADFLHMCRGAAVTAAEIAAIDAYLTTVAEHGMNASSYAARVIASTRAGLIWAAIGGFCALTGPLHGGAPGPVLDMLDRIGTADRAEPWLSEAIEQGERLMGFGHRIYRTRDPRADILKAQLAGLPHAAESRAALAEQVESTALRILSARYPDRSLDTNVEFYTALLLDALQIPRAAFTAVFAVGRMAGWTAHALEQERTGRLIRPASRYIGPVPVAA